MALTLTFMIGSGLALLFAVLDRWVDDGVYAHLDTVLANQARSLATGLEQLGPERIEGWMTNYQLPGHTEFFSVFDAEGRALLNSGNSHGQALPLPAGLTPPAYYDIRTPDGHFGRAYAIALDGGPDGRWRTLVVTTEREGWDATEQRIHSALLSGFALAIGVVVVLTLVAVQRAFAPLIREGERIARLDVGRPLKPLGDGMPRELLPFASAFNVGIGRLYQAIERERRFSSDIAHELRTPVTEIQICAETALREDGRVAMRDGLESAIAASQRMQRSVDTLLMLARLESGQDPLALDPLDLVELAGAQVQALRRVAADRGIELRLQATAPVWVHSDVGILERILANLLQNAIDYAPGDGSVDCVVETAAAGGAVVEVVNHAPALTEDDLTHFGQRFWRKQGEGGTAHHAGLGLTLAATFAAMLGSGLDFRLEQGRLHARLGPLKSL